MIVKKIKIEQELMDIEYNGLYQEASIPEMSYISLKEGEVPETMVTSTITNYEVKQVWDGKEKENYLVKINDLKVFDDLLHIGINDINEIIDKNNRKFYEEMEGDYKLKISSKIKQLENNHLWRRIFKKYV